MRRTYRKRLREVSTKIDAIPIAPAAEERAFNRFRRTGESRGWALLRRGHRAEGVFTLSLGCCASGPGRVCG